VVVRGISPRLKLSSLREFRTTAGLVIASLPTLALRFLQFLLPILILTIRHRNDKEARLCHRKNSARGPSHLRRFLDSRPRGYDVVDMLYPAHLRPAFVNSQTLNYTILAVGVVVLYPSTFRVGSSVNDRPNQTKVR